MKKMIALVLAFATGSCLVSFGGPFSSETKLTVMRRGDIFKVVYGKPSRGKVKVLIYDAKGNEVFAERVASKSGFIRPYNFSMLPKGDYKVCVQDESGELTEEIRFHEKIWPAHIAKIKSSQKFLVSVPHQQRGEVLINIYDADERLIYEATESLDGGFARVYDLKDLDAAKIQLVNQSTGEEKYFYME